MKQQEIENISDKQLHEFCQRTGANIRKLQREFATYLVEVHNRRLYKKYGFYSLYEYAAKLAGMSHNTVDEILNVSEKLKDKPNLYELMGDQGWSKLRVVATIATVETQKFWSEKVVRMSKVALEMYVHEWRRQEETKRMQDQELKMERAGRGPNAELPSAQAGICRPAQLEQGQLSGVQTGIFLSAHELEGQSQQTAIFTDFSNIERLIPGESIPAAESQSFRYMQPLPEEPVGHIGSDVQNNSRKTLSFKIDSKIETRLRIFKQKLEKQRHEPIEWNEVMKALLDSAQVNAPKKLKNETGKTGQQGNLADAEERPGSTNKAQDHDLEKQKQIIQKNLPKISTRYIPAKVRHYLEEKYQGKCAYPYCTKPKEIDHHTRRFSLIPNHDPDYITPLCKAHERIAHQGFIENEEKSSLTWKVQAEPDKNSPKFAIDLMVQKYRQSDA